jgi:pimeloyl-[acyl-carrier protein] methyl ester esterase
MSLTLNIEAAGDSPLPLVCLHGWGMNLRVFDLLREALEPAGIEFWAMDLPGHGRSPWDAERASFAHQVQDVLLNLPQRCVLLGWSLGGQFALEIARVAPQRVAGLVLIATTPRFSKSVDWAHGMEPTAMEAFREAVKRDWRQTLADFIWLQLRGSDHAALAQQWIREALKGHGLPRSEALEAGLSILATNDLRNAVASIAHPTLLMAGQNDRITRPVALAWMSEQMARARYLEIPRAGHAPFLSHVEECAAPLRDFLVDVADLAEPKSNRR